MKYYTQITFLPGEHKCLCYAVTFVLDTNNWWENGMVPMSAPQASGIFELDDEMVLYLKLKYRDFKIFPITDNECDALIRGETILFNQERFKQLQSFYDD